MFAYNDLTAEALRLGQARWPWKPKLHQWDHGVGESVRTGISMASHWAMSDEDWAGKIAALLLAGHAVTRHITALEKWVIYIYSEYTDLL